MDKCWIALLLAALLGTGCGTASTSTGNDNWAYTGRDDTLRSPPSVPRGDMPLETRQQLFREGFEAWRKKQREAADAAKDACARQTGEDRTPGIWRGYSTAFMDCMKVRGWIRVSNPL